MNKRNTVTFEVRCIAGVYETESEADAMKYARTSGGAPPGMEHGPHRVFRVERSVSERETEIPVIPEPAPEPKPAQSSKRASDTAVLDFIERAILPDFRSLARNIMAMERDVKRGRDD